MLISHNPTPTSTASSSSCLFRVLFSLLRWSFSNKADFSLASKPSIYSFFFLRDWQADSRFFIIRCCRLRTFIYEWGTGNLLMLECYHTCKERGTLLHKQWSYTFFYGEERGNWGEGANKIFYWKKETWNSGDSYHGSCCFDPELLFQLQPSLNLIKMHSPCKQHCI